MLIKYFFKPLLFLLLIGAISASSAESANTNPTPGFKLSGWTEAVVSVSNLEQTQQFFEQVAGWKAIAKGEVDRATLERWNLPNKASANFIVVANPGTKSGYIRLVSFSGVEQQLMRPFSQSWDTGGIFDLNVRVKNMDEQVPLLRKWGWQAASEPVQFTFGPFVVKEWIVTNPDGLAFAMIERIEPVLEGWPHFKKISRTFNATQVVRDMPESRKFYTEVLGFKPYLEHTGASKEPGPNVLGLPHNLTTEIPRQVYILHPQGINEGSVELLSFDGAVGRDFRHLAKAPNLGILSMRFPVEGIEELREHLIKHKTTVTGINTENAPPIGKQRIFTAVAPEGAWLEFYQAK